MPGLAQNWGWIAAIGWYAAVSLATLGLFVWDKRAAAGGRRRVRERTLLGLVWLGGFLGAVAAMQWTRHKTRQWLFRLTPVVAATIHVAAWIGLVRLMGNR